MTVVQEMEKAQADLAAALTERDDLAGKVTAAEAIASEASAKIVAPRRRARKPSQSVTSR